MYFDVSMVDISVHSVLITKVGIYLNIAQARESRFTSPQKVGQRIIFRPLNKQSSFDLNFEVRCSRHHEGSSFPAPPQRSARLTD